MNSDTEHYFISLLVICMSSFVTCLILLSIFNWDVVLSCLRPHIFHILIPYLLYSSQMLSPIPCFVFIVLIVHIVEEFYYCDISIFAFVVCVLEYFFCILLL